MIKTGLVTGAASGLGYEFSILLAQDSFDLVLVDIDEEKLITVKQQIRAIYQVHVDIIICDLSQPGCVELIYEQIKDRNIDVLINNAGFGLYGFFSETEWELEESMIYMHIMVMTHLTKLILKGMIKMKSGKILNLSSVAAFQPGPLMAVYYATKAYILSFSEALANEVKGTGVTVTVLCPGQTKTNFQKITAKNSKEKLSSAGFLSPADPVKVALYGYNDMHSGYSKSVPGLINKFLILASRITPNRFSLPLIRKIQVQMRK